MKWKPIKDWVLARAQERSTWKGIVTAVATVAGVAIAPEKAELITTIGVSLASLFLIQTKEK